MKNQILLVTVLDDCAHVDDVTATWADRTALVEQLTEARRQRDEADATNADALAALGAAEADAAIWKRRAERAEAAIAETLAELRAQLQPDAAPATDRAERCDAGERRDAAACRA